MLDKLVRGSALAAGAAGLSPSLPKLMAALMEARPTGVPWALKADDPGLLAELRAQGLSPWVYRRLAGLGLEEAVAPQVRRQLRHDFALALKTSARQDLETGLVLRALAAAGVAVILLKGADLRRRVYEDPASRPMVDLDLLIAPGDKSRAEAVLTDLGYTLSPQCVDPRPGFRERFRRELHFTPPPGLILLLDLHWQLAYGDGFYHLPYLALQEAAVPWECLGVAVRVLSPEHLLLHLALHAWDEFHGALQILDLALVLRLLPLDWPRFLAESSRCRCRALVYPALREVGRLLPGVVPAAVLQELAGYSPNWAETLVLRRRLGYFTRHFAVFYHHRRLQDWRFYVASLLWPQPQYLAAVYGQPDRAVFLRQFLATLFSADKSWTPH
jgi:hypothetical protein